MSINHQIPRTKLRQLRDDLERCLHLVVFEVRKTHVGSALGLGWAIAEPLMFLGTYFFLLVIVLNVSYAGPGGSMGHLLSMFSGLVPWLFFSNCMSRGTTILKTHGALVKQINFPIYMLPFIMVAQVSVEFLISLTLLMGLAVWIGLISWSTLVLLPAVFLLAVFLIAAAFIVSCYNIMLPDLGKLIPTFLRMALFITPVLYLPADLPENIRFLVYINPMSYFIVPFRYAFLNTHDVFVFNLVTDMNISLGIAITTIIIALLHRNFIRSTVVDYI